MKDCEVNGLLEKVLDLSSDLELVARLELLNEMVRSGDRRIEGSFFGRNGILSASLILGMQKSIVQRLLENEERTSDQRPIFETIKSGSLQETRFISDLLKLCIESTDEQSQSLTLDLISRLLFTSKCSNLI